MKQLNIETVQINGEAVPVIQNEVFLVDFGPATGQQAKITWLAQFRMTLNEVCGKTQGITVAPVDVLAWGKTGRTVLRVYAPDPTFLVYDAEIAMQDGPKVVLL